MPDLTGLTQAEAEAALADADLTLGAVNPEPSESSRPAR